MMMPFASIDRASDGFVAMERAADSVVDTVYAFGDAMPPRDRPERCHLEPWGEGRGLRGFCISLKCRAKAQRRFARWSRVGRAKRHAELERLRRV